MSPVVVLCFSSVTMTGMLVVPVAMGAGGPYVCGHPVPYCGGYPVEAAGMYPPLLELPHIGCDFGYDAPPLDLYCGLPDPYYPGLYTSVPGPAPPPPPPPPAPPLPPQSQPQTQLAPVKMIQTQLSPLKMMQTVPTVQPMPSCLLTPPSTPEPVVWVRPRLGPAPVADPRTLAEVHSPGCVQQWTKGLHLGEYTVKCPTGRAGCQFDGVSTRHLHIDG